MDKIMKMNSVKKLLFETQNALIRNYIKLKFLDKYEWQLERIGNEYSGYWYPANLLALNGTIWGVGLGLDSSFEKELLNRGYTVLGFEPEIRCYEVSCKQLKNPKSKIFNFGLWDKKGLFKYTGDNISIVDIFNKGEYRDSFLDIRSLWDVAQELSLELNERPRVLRMNIEGAEREILLRFIEEPLPFDVIIFQAEFLFHLSFKSIRNRIRAIKELERVLTEIRKSGWKLVGLNRNQITLVKDR